MTDKKLTDKEIKKALECCSSNVLFEHCVDCPFDNVSKAICTIRLSMVALDYINRQEKKIEELETALFNLGAENERLCIEIDELIIAKDLLFDEAEALIKKAKAEARKEFAERLKKHERYATDVFDHTTYIVVKVEDIDKVLEETENGK